MKSLKQLLLSLFVMTLSMKQTFAQDKQIGNETGAQKQQRMAWWTNDRFGMFTIFLSHPMHAGEYYF